MALNHPDYRFAGGNGGEARHLADIVLEQTECYFDHRLHTAGQAIGDGMLPIEPYLFCIIQAVCFCCKDINIFGNKRKRCRISSGLSISLSADGS